jgi:hypothetical protein
MTTTMKALVCLAAVCIIAWCAADIAIKLRQVQVLDGQRAGLAGIANALETGSESGRTINIAEVLDRIRVCGGRF